MKKRNRTAAEKTTLKSKRARRNQLKRETVDASNEKGEYKSTKAKLETTDDENHPLCKKMTTQEKCDLIAELSESILEDPDKAFISIDVEGGDLTTETIRRGPSKMQQLLSLASFPNTQTHTQSDRYIAQLAIMSLLAIFKDIIPAYRIRVPTAQEMAVKLSKETKRIWDHERQLLHNYQQYLKLLERTWEKQSPGISVAAILCMAELLKSAYHFNFRSNLLTAVVRQMNNNGQQAEAVQNACCQAIEFVFANDAQGEVTLEAARQVAKLIKDRGYKVKPVVLRTFLALPLRVHVDEAEAARIATKANARKRKHDKKTADIEADIREGQATVDKILLARCQADTLQTVILTYFRVLKSENLKANHIERLLPPTLEGLAKFAHLINIDTVIDLLAVLKSLLKKVDELPVDAALNCILTAFQTLQGPGNEMKIDQKEYIMPLYCQLPRLCSEENSRKNVDTMIQCLDASFLKRREFSMVRVAAFLKQILTTALHAPVDAAVPLIAFARLLIQRYPAVEQLMENELDVITSGEYLPDVEDPEQSNSFATSAWEVATLKFHFHPTVVSQAEGAAALKILQLPAELPEKLRETLLADVESLYIPYKRNMKKHPLEPKHLENVHKKKRVQARFVTPREKIQQKWNN
jgi:nucleolar complex protein 3